MSKMFVVLTAGLAALAVVAVAPEPASAAAGPLDYSAGCPGGGAYDGVRCVGGKRPAPRHKPRTEAAAPAPSPAAEETLPASAAPAESSAAPESSAPAPTGFGQTAPAPHKGGGVFGWLASLWAAIIGFIRGLFGH